MTVGAYLKKRYNRNSKTMEIFEKFFSRKANQGIFEYIFITKL